MITIKIEETKIQIEVLDTIITMLQKLRDVLVCGKCHGMDVVDGVCDLCNGSKRKGDRAIMHAKLDKDIIDRMISIGVEDNTGRIPNP